MTAAKKSATFYIRIQKSDEGLHRVGCVIMKRVNATHLAVGWSLCNPEDRFDPLIARVLAIKRLKTNPTIVPNEEVECEVSNRFYELLGLEEYLMKYDIVSHSTMYGYSPVAWNKNDSAMSGAYKDLFPSSQVKA